MQILNIDGEPIWDGEADNIREAVEKASKSGAQDRAYLRGADLSDADLSDAYLSGAYLSRADLSDADLRGAYLSRADLSDAYLRGADLSGAYLRGADLSDADLSDADLSGAYLSGAYLSRADLSGADLSGADLSGADLSGAQGITPERCTPLLMLRDQPGPIRAYKLITADGVGPYNGGINYLVSEEFEVAKANDDPNAHCGAGINLATLDWCMREWRDGYRILVMEFTAEDIACIPTATDGKFRVRRCRRVGEKDLVALGLVAAPPDPREAPASPEERGE